MNMEQKRDKIFPKSDKVDHQKMTFQNRYGITLAADVYLLKQVEAKMAERGFVTLSVDLPIRSESNGQPCNAGLPRTVCGNLQRGCGLPRNADFRRQKPNPRYRYLRQRRLAHQHAAEPKELDYVKGAGHADLYDRVNLIPFDKLNDFFTQNLK